MKKGKLIAGFMILLILSVTLLGCSMGENEVAADSEDSRKSTSIKEHGNQQGTEKLLVEVSKAKKDNLKIKLDLTGELKAFRKVNLVPEISGVVKELNFAEGDRVKEGELILVLDQTIEEAKVAQARSNLKMAQVQLAKLKAGAREEEIEQAQAGLEQAQASLKNAKSNFERMKRLFEKGVVSKSKYDSTESNYQVAKAQVNSARGKLQLVKKGPRTEEIQAAEAKVEQAKASLNLSESRFDKTTIESPIKGVIAKKNIELGEMASVGKPVVRLVQMNKLEFEGSISTNDLSKVRVGQPVDIKVDAYPNRTFTGKIDQVSPTVNPSNRGVKLTVRIKNKDLSLKPGMFATGEILVNKLNDVLLIPEAAVREKERRKRVLIAKNGVVKKRNVKLGLASNGQIVVNEGLKEGDLVITQGPSNLQPGTKVKVLKRGEN